MIGIFTARENEARLDRIQARLRRRDLDPEERADLEQCEAELQQWFSDLWRIEGGGAD